MCCRGARSHSTWTLAGYQQILNAIRGFGATNICICNGNSYSQQLENYTVWKPTDTLSPPQIAMGAHPYPNGTYPYSDGDVYGKIGNDTGGGTANAIQWAAAVVAANVAMIFTEDGGRGGTSATATPAEPHMAYMQAQADLYGIGYVFWQWNNTRAYGTVSEDFYSTVYASDGVTILPILGTGTQPYTWMTAHA